MTDWYPSRESSQHQALLHQMAVNELTLIVAAMLEEYRKLVPEQPRPRTQASPQPTEQARTDTLGGIFARGREAAGRAAGRMATRARAAATAATATVERFVQRIQGPRLSGLQGPPDPSMVTMVGREWVDRHVGLVSSLPEQMLPRVQELVREAWGRGDSPQTLARALAQAVGATASQARTIARHQIGLLSSSLTQARQVAAGVHYYTWQRTVAQDPREEHLARVGQVFAWAIPPPGGHPGTEINCQCGASPFSGLTP